MIEDMNARKLGAHSQRSHISSCRRFAAFLMRSPDTATPDDVRGFQLHLAETGMSICNRNRIMTLVKFLFRVTLRRLDLTAEIYHLREPQKIPQVMSPDETRRLLAVASNLKVRTLQRSQPPKGGGVPDPLSGTLNRLKKRQSCYAPPLSRAYPEGCVPPKISAA
jgi:site-specific recombinase XerD